MIPKLPRLFVYLLAALLVLNLLQSIFTRLIFDEAYYWHYAQELAWGYFDHPPMVALMIKISSFFFKGELGVRFVSCVLSVGTLPLLWLLVDHPKKKNFVPHFFVLVLSMTLLNAYGFFTLPDTPLLFFTALFLWCYKKFIEKPSAALSIALGIVMAALMYSKYHAVLVILFVLFSNIKLVFNKYAWLAVLVALLCYTPHFMWLYQNDFVTIRYHLFERPNRAYEFGDFTLGFLIGLIAIFGLIFPWVYLSLFRTRAKDKFTKALLYLIYGTVLFFFISSFNRRVQTQWIIVISIPMVLVVFNHMLQNDTVRKWIWRVGIVNLLVLFYLRLGLIFEPLFPIVYESHGNKELVQTLASKVGNLPVVFENSYRQAPMYTFYTGNPSFSLNNIYYRKNQFDIDDSESKIQHQKVVYISRYLKNGDISYHDPKGVLHWGVYMENFESFRKLQCYMEDVPVSVDQPQPLGVKLYNPYAFGIALEKLKFSVAYLNDYKQVKEVLPLKMEALDKNVTQVAARDTAYFNFRLPIPKKSDPGYFKIVISENGLPLGLNSESIPLD
ncbi:glycosyltransferase family 39 protein [Flavobacteriaceae bacterium 3-367]